MSESTLSPSQGLRIWLQVCAECSVADPDPGSAVFLDPWIRDPGWVKKTGSGSRMNNPDYISESLKNFLEIKYLNALIWIRDPEWEKFGSGMEKNSDPGSGINIPDPQHWLNSYLVEDCNVVIKRNDDILLHDSIQ